MGTPLGELDRARLRAIAASDRPLAIGHYDLHDGQLCRTPILPDQPSPPSDALYEALHPTLPPAGSATAWRRTDAAARGVRHPAAR